MLVQPGFGLQQYIITWSNNLEFIEFSQVQQSHKSEKIFWVDAFSEPDQIVRRWKANF
mgnify:FL=1